MAGEATGSLLIILLETHAAAWAALGAPSPTGGSGIPPPAFIAQVGAFVGSYELEAEGNEAVVLAVHTGCCPLLYQSPSRRSPGDDDGAVLPDSDPTIADALAAGVAALLEGDTSPSSPTPPPPPALAAALASALCIAARECPPVVEAEEVAGGAPAAPVARRAPPPRILILAAAAAAAAGDAYVPVMNAVFAAQKLGVPIDVALLGGAHGAGVLAPAPHLTHGVLHTPRDRGALITHLISIFAPSVATRASLALPRATGGVDLGASCFCHASRVDIGHVCSVCLSIWCEPVDACATCGSSFTVGPGAGSKRAAGNG